MERKIINGTFKTEKGELVNESFEADFYPDKAFEIYSDIIERFNDEEKDRKIKFPSYPISLRIPISAEYQGDKVKIYCDFSKTSSGTLKDSKGYYDRVVCSRCGLVRKRRNIDSSDVSKIVCKTSDIKDDKVKIKKKICPFCNSKDDKAIQDINKNFWCNNCHITFRQTRNKDLQ